MESTPSPDPSPTPARDPSPAPSRTTPPRTPTSPHTPHTTRRQTLAALAATAATAAVPVLAPGAASARDRGERPVADTVLHNGRVTTLDPRHPRPPPSPCAETESSPWAPTPGSAVSPGTTPG
ncbi:amidohydrolase [Streptomyces alboflavus]|uniref:Amidohydrolase n=1 Tax=Streptomyces alboflavus TaxID=67267 RepID=A0A1Z1WPM5_9ACTN|nr:hypothetical protein [Streptomyces alboflavus]ARX88375.1 amidohydrolase [Streptomyces alboflavus]